MLLTELPNRCAFNIRLGEEIKRSGRSGPLSFLIVDLDEFKDVNDVHGHQAGDQVLRDVSDCFCPQSDKRILRSSDFVARAGGDEFYILLPNTDAEGACIAAHRISKSIGEDQLTIMGKEGSKVIKLSSSIGVSQFTDMKQDPEGKQMIYGADECLYIMKGKRPDKNGVTQERRGKIACGGYIISPDDIKDLIRKKQRPARIKT